MKNGRKLLCHLTALAVVTVWGSTFVFTKLLLLAGLSAAQIFTLRFIVAYVLLLLYALSRPNFRLFSCTVADELLMAGLGLTGGSLYFLTENSAMNYTTTTNTSLIVSLCPLLTTVLVTLFHPSERLVPRQILGTLIAAAGVIIVVFNGHFVLHLSPLGDALAFAACLCWAVYSLLIIPAHQRYDTLFITRKVFFYGLLTVMPYALVSPLLPPPDLLFRPDVLANLLFLGCVASMLCFLAWNAAMKEIGAVTTTNYAYFNPVTTVLFAWVLLSEKITLYFVTGTILILVGLLMADRPSKTPNKNT